MMINVMASPRLGPGLLGRHSLPPHCGDGRVNWCRSWAAGVGAGSGVVARAPVSKEPHDGVFFLEYCPYRLDVHHVKHVLDSRVRPVARPREDNCMPRLHALLIRIANLHGTALSLGAVFVAACKELANLVSSQRGTRLLSELHERDSSLSSTNLELCHMSASSSETSSASPRSALISARSTRFRSDASCCGVRTTSPVRCSSSLRSSAPRDSLSSEASTLAMRCIAACSFTADGSVMGGWAGPRVCPRTAGPRMCDGVLDRRGAAISRGATPCWPAGLKP